MLAFHNDPKVKAKYLKRVRAHFLADEIRKNRYWVKGIGCAVGCTIHSADFSSYETELGIPEVLARLEERILENLPNELAQTWPGRFLSAIEVGANLSRVWPKFAIFLLTDESQYHSRYPQCVTVAKAFQDELDGIAVNWGPVRKAAAYAAANTAAAAKASNAAYHAAYDAAADVAGYDATITAYASYATDTAAYNANYAAACAATADVTAVTQAAAAAYYAAATVTRGSKPYIAQSEKLLELLAEARPESATKSC